MQFISKRVRYAFQRMPFLKRMDAFIFDREQRSKVLKEALLLLLLGGIMSKKRYKCNKKR